MFARLSLLLTIWIAPAAWAEDAAPLTSKDVHLSVRSGTSVLHYYPEAANRAGITGKGAALCQVASSGRLVDCAVQSEEPATYGFGAATVRVAEELIRLAPKAKDGTPTNGRSFLFAMTFRLPR